MLSNIFPGLRNEEFTFIKHAYVCYQLPMVSPTHTFVKFSSPITSTCVNALLPLLSMTRYTLLTLALQMLYPLQTLDHLLNSIDVETPSSLAWPVTLSTRNRRAIFHLPIFFWGVPLLALHLLKIYDCIFKIYSQFSSSSSSSSSSSCSNSPSTPFDCPFRMLYVDRMMRKNGRINFDTALNNYI